MMIENHWGLTTKVENVIRIHKAVNSPWLGVNLDTGNYPEDPYSGHHDAGAVRIDRAGQDVLRRRGGTRWTWTTSGLRASGSAGFPGCVSLEMEGKEPAETAVPKSLAVLRSAFV